MRRLKYHISSSLPWSNLVFSCKNQGFLKEQTFKKSKVKQRFYLGEKRKFEPGFYEGAKRQDKGGNFEAFLAIKSEEYRG